MCDQCDDIPDYNSWWDAGIYFYRSRSKPDGQYCLKYPVLLDGEETVEFGTINIEYCPWCGRKLSEEG
jgi:hypothetical protein